MGTLHTTAVEHSRQQLRTAQVSRTPYPHCRMEQFFDERVAEALLEQLEQLDWTVQARRFYVQHSSGSLADAVGSSPARLVCEPALLAAVRGELERLFDVRLNASRIKVYAHRMLPGHRIGVHNDDPTDSDTETHRLLVCLGRPGEEAGGGELVLFSPDDVDGSTVLVRPVPNSAVAIEFSPRSYHCVAEVTSGVRYTLIYSFWPAVQETAAPRPRPAAGAVSDRKFSAMLTALEQAGCYAIPHTRRTLGEHLVGTYEILARWNCDADVRVAGLFHSVFGTATLPPAPEAMERAAEIRDLIGERAFVLMTLFADLTWNACFDLLKNPRVVERGMPARLAPDDVSALVSLLWANVVEQHQRVPLHPDDLDLLAGHFAETSAYLSSLAQQDVGRLLGQLAATA